MRCSKALTPLVTGFAIVALSSEAFAGPDEENKPPVAVRRHRSAEILMRTQEPRGETTGSWLENVTLRKGMGLVYRYKFETKDKQKMVLNVGGPALKKKRLGLMIELKF
jgi:hypothetical protein